MICVLVVAMLGAAPKQVTVKASDGQSITVWEKKPRGAAKATVVLVHGRTWSALPDFDLQVPGEKLSLMDALVERGYAVEAIDLRGYGATPRDASGWNTAERAVADIEAVLDSVAGKPVLLGWSMGSMLAELVAQKRSGKLSAVVLYAFPYDPEGAKPDPEPAEPPKKANTEEAAASDFITPGSISKKAVDAYVAAAMKADPVKADWRAWEQWKVIDGASVSAPVLLIHGERDPIAKTAAMSRLWAKLGAADRSWVTLPGSDHAAHLEKPAAFVSAVVAFIERPR